ncbi:MAG: LysE family transporter [Spirochaetes bacterium]|nr:LysE family transporter [Spirochaetota bacterium]
MKNGFKIFRQGLTTGLFLQLAIGPVFFYIADLTLQRSAYDGFAAVAAVTIVDYFYITLSITGIGEFLNRKKTKKVFGIISSAVLMIFGILIIKSSILNGLQSKVTIETSGVISSFISVLILTLSSPLTIVFFTGIFAAKAVENNYTKKELFIFGFSTGSATFTFMGSSVIFFSLLRKNVPAVIMHALNLSVGTVLIVYGIIRIRKILKPESMV